MGRRPALRNTLRPIARRLRLAAPQGAWWLARTPPWQLPHDWSTKVGVWCIACRWEGDHFLGDPDGESALCPRCGAIARDRFLLWSFLTRTPNPSGLRVLETSPRLGPEHEMRMRRWFSYRSSDFDLQSHRAELMLDLQDISLPDRSVDIVLTPHVLEHVPDTRRALSELFRILAPGGRIYLQVPLVYGDTSVPSIPEFHADNTPVCFNFGWDLTDMMRAAGFTSTVLVPQGYFEMLSGWRPFPPSPAEGFHLEWLHRSVRLDDLTVAVDDRESKLLGLEPSYHFSTWEAIRPRA